MKYWIFRNSKGLNITGNYMVFPNNQECISENLFDVLLIHAFPFDSSMYFINLEHETLTETLNQISLEKGKIRVFLPNLPGFGESDHFHKEPKDLIPYVNIINNIVKKFNIQNLIIGGCSMGGYIALEYMRNHIKSLRGLILIDTKTMADNSEQKQNRYNTINNIKEALKIFTEKSDVLKKIETLYMKSRKIKEFIDGLHSKIVTENSAKINPEVSEKIKNMMKQQNPTGILHALNAMAGRRDNTHLLKNFDKEVLIIVGEHDIITPIEISKQMKNLVPKSTLEIIPNAGHLSNIENPIKFNQALLNWIKTES